MKQISPGIWVPNVKQKKEPMPKFCKPMAICKHCGTENTIQHSKYPTMCQTCGKRYVTFKNNIWHLKQGANDEREETLRRQCRQYVMLYNKGFQVPPSVLAYLRKYGYID